MGRHYPDRPVVGVGAVVMGPDGAIVLVRRGQAPLAGSWSLPGGALELGETLVEGIAREVREETGLVVEVGPVVEVFEHISRDEAGGIPFHYVLIDYVCHAVGGALAAGSDVTDVAWSDPSQLERFALTPKALSVIERACAVATTARGQE